MAHEVGPCRTVARTMQGRDSWSLSQGPSPDEATRRGKGKRNSGSKRNKRKKNSGHLGCVDISSRPLSGSSTFGPWAGMSLRPSWPSALVRAILGFVSPQPSGQHEPESILALSTRPTWALALTSGPFLACGHPAYTRSPPKSAEPPRPHKKKFRPSWSNRHKRVIVRAF